MKRQIEIHTHYANGEPTYWPEMIIEGLHKRNPQLVFNTDQLQRMSFNIGLFSRGVAEKIHHIIPEGFEGDPGEDIELLAVTPQGEKFPFGPLVKCMGVQSISIMPFEKMGLTIIDRGDIIAAAREEIVAKNEGFNSVEHWYCNVPFENDWKIWKGSIIHWTDKRY